MGGVGGVGGDGGDGGGAVVVGRKLEAVECCVCVVEWPRRQWWRSSVGVGRGLKVRCVHACMCTHTLTEEISLRGRAGSMCWLATEPPAIEPAPRPPGASLSTESSSESDEISDRARGSRARGSGTRPGEGPGPDRPTPGPMLLLRVLGLACGLGLGLLRALGDS